MKILNTIKDKLLKIVEFIGKHPFLMVELIWCVWMVCALFMLCVSVVPFVNSLQGFILFITFVYAIALTLKRAEMITKTEDEEDGNTGTKS